MARCPTRSCLRAPPDNRQKCESRYGAARTARFYLSQPIIEKCRQGSEFNLQVADFSCSELKGCSLATALLRSRAEGGGEAAGGTWGPNLCVAPPAGPRCPRAKATIH